MSHTHQYWREGVDPQWKYKMNCASKSGCAARQGVSFQQQELELEQCLKCHHPFHAQWPSSCCSQIPQHHLLINKKTFACHVKCTKTITMPRKPIAVTRYKENYNYVESWTWRGSMSYVYKMLKIRKHILQSNKKMPSAV